MKLVLLAQALLIYGSNTFPEDGESNKNTKGRGDHAGNRFT